jgi:ubiquinone/menaquinone biosynthesis C-methylase UbiE
MNDFTNQDFLLQNQYKDSSNFQTRMSLMQKFTKDQINWYHWIFDHFTFPPNSRILEIGCGPGNLWKNNLDRIPDDWHIIASDFSAGMLQDAQEALKSNQHSFTYQQIDAQSIPLEDASQDAVIANAMLYHVPNIPQALAEIRRVLKPGGKFYATTVSGKPMQEMSQLLASSTNANLANGFGLTFTLDNGEELIRAQFTDVQIERLHLQLSYPSPEPVLIALASILPDEETKQQFTATLRPIYEREIEQHGAIKQDFEFGIFIASGIKS